MILPCRGVSAVEDERQEIEDGRINTLDDGGVAALEDSLD